MAIGCHVTRKYAAFPASRLPVCGFGGQRAASTQHQRAGVAGDRFALFRKIARARWLDQFPRRRVLRHDNCKSG